MKSVFCSEIPGFPRDLSWSEASEGAEEYRLSSSYLFCMSCSVCKCCKL